MHLKDMKINYKYLILAVILFIIEVYIAFFVRDNIIRPFIGDTLVVGLIYFFIKSFMKKSSRLLGGYIFLFACFIEIAQYFNLISLLHMENSKVAKIIFGSTFDLNDIFCYFAGTIIIYIYEALVD